MEHVILPGGYYWDYSLGVTVLNEVSNLFEEGAHLDFLCGCPIFKWVAQTSLKDTQHQVIGSRHIANWTNFR